MSGRTRTTLSLLLASAAFLAVPGCFSGASSRPASQLPGGPGSAEGAGYGLPDLSGAWTGLLLPGNGTEPVPLALRFDASGEPVRAWDALGDAWAPGASVLEASVSPGGGARLIYTRIRDAVGHDVLSLVGRLGPAASAAAGDYALQHFGVLVSSGRWELVRSSGPGAFSPEQLAGDWSGPGFQTQDGRWHPASLSLDAAGVVTGGSLDGRPFTVGDPATALVLADTELGLLLGSSLPGAGASLTTFDFLLLDEAGAHLGGPGVDSVLGPGILRLHR